MYKEVVVTRYSIFFPCILLSSLLTPGLLAAPSPACPTVLAASGLDMGVSNDYIAEIYRHIVGDTIVLQSADSIQTAVWDSLPGSTYRISVEQTAPAGANGQPAVKTTLASLSCPLPRQWRATPLPRLAISYPTAFQNGATPPNLYTTYARDGLLLWDVDLDLTGSTRVELALMWRYETEDATRTAAGIYVPPLANGRTEVQEPFAVAAQRRSPVMALRLATSETPVSAPRWASLWHVASENMMRHWRDGAERQELMGPLANDGSFPNMDRSRATAASVSLSLLDRFDTATQRSIACEHVAGASYDCLAFNARVYKYVMQAIRTGDPVYVQLLVALDRGYALQSYQLAANADGPELIAQRYIRDTSELRLPSSIFR